MMKLMPGIESSPKVNFRSEFRTLQATIKWSRADLFRANQTSVVTFILLILRVYGTTIVSGGRQCRN